MILNNTIDWSATAAWIALAISITGTILGPIATSVLNNRHQIKLKKLEMMERASSEKERIFRDCISSIGLVVSCMSLDNLNEFGKSFHNVYVYVPTDKWQELDIFFHAVIDNDLEKSISLCPQIVSLLTELITKTPQVNP